MNRLPLTAAVLFALAALSCAEKEPLPPLTLAEGCQPLLNGADCMLPFPSDQFRVADETMPSGFRITVPTRSRVRTTQGLADPTSLHPIDGFSRTSPIVAMFPSGVSPEGFTDVNADPTTSVADGSPSLLIDADTLERVPHFVDVDPRAKSLDRQAIVIHPLVAMKPRTRYLVALRSVKLPDGSGLVVAPEGFRRLRDSEAKGDPVLEPLSARFDKDVFPRLVEAGLKRAELQLAWDFTTGSLEHPRADMLRVRELTLAWLSTHTPTINITDVENSPDPNVWRRIKGTYTVPLFVETADPGAALTRDAAGKVRQNGETQAPFFVSIPNSVATAGVSGTALFYGHGFFGGFGELGSGAARNISEQMKATLIATEWWGMATPDVGIVAAGLTGKPSETMKFSDRVHQGMANWLVLSEATRVFAGNVNFQFANGTPAFAAAPPRSFLGISQGHILGGILIPMSPTIDRAVLQVGGASFTTMMMRAHPFAGFLLLMETTVKDPLEQQKFIAALQAPFNRVDPAAYADLFFESPLQNTPTDRRVLMQFGFGDTSVPNIGTTLHARMLGLRLLAPSPKPVYGLSEVSGPVEGSAVAAYDFGVDTAATYRLATPPELQTEVHGAVRELTAGLAQARTFVETGTIVNACAGPCDPQ